jgi:FOG: Ankyrin repeat
MTDDKYKTIGSESSLEFEPAAKLVVIFIFLFFGGLFCSCRNDREPNVTIYEAVKQGDLKAFQQLLKIDSAILNTQNADTDELPFFHFVVKYCPNVEIIRILVEQYEVDVNAKGRIGRTPIHESASYNSDVEILKYLVSQGADVNTKCRFGATPLYHAALSNPNVEILKYLVSQGADVNENNYFGVMPFDVAKSEEKKAYLRSVGGKSGRKN